MLIVVVVLAVATAVPAAVLYVLVSGLTEESTGVPVSLGMNVISTAGPVSSPASYYIAVSLEPSGSVAPSEFGLHLSNTSTGAVPLISASDSCVAGAKATETNCTASAPGWYAVLVAENGGVLGTYSSVGSQSGWTNLAEGALSESLAPGDSFLLVSESSVANGYYVLSPFGTGTTSVGGAIVL